MENLELKSVIKVCQMEDLNEEERHLVELAIEATNRSYSPYSHFKVGAAVRLENGVELSGSNQENAAYPSGICAERTTLFYAGAPMKILLYGRKHVYVMEGIETLLPLCFSEF